MTPNAPKPRPRIVRQDAARDVRSVFNDEKKLSNAALSQTLPDRLTTALSVPRVSRALVGPLAFDGEPRNQMERRL